MSEVLELPAVQHTEILEVPEIRQRVMRWSVAEYEQMVEEGKLPKNVELIRGLIIERMPKSPLHSYIAEWLYDALREQVPREFSAFTERPLRLADSEPEPDVCLVKGSRANFRTSHPTTAELVIEVAVTSAARDRQAASMYAEAGVKEYWIVLAEERQVEVYRRPENGTYREKTVVDSNATLRCEHLPSLAVSLKDLFQS